MSSVGTRSQAAVYHVSEKIAGKSCSACAQQLQRGQKIKFSRDSIQKTSAPRHLRCPQRPITTKVFRV